MAQPDLHLSHPPTVKQGMLIHRPVGDVFRAIVDPTVTTKFWFTKSSGRLEPGAHVRWEWEMFEVSADVVVEEIEENRRIRMEWGNAGQSTTVEWLFVPVGDDSTCVSINETGLRGNGDELAAYATGSVGGFTIVLCALKALLEHDVILQAVRDHREDCSSL